MSDEQNIPYTSYDVNLIVLNSIITILKGARSMLIH